MVKFFRNLFFYSFLFSILCFLSFTPALAAIPSELKGNIDQKSRQLQEINDKIKENQKILEEVQDKGKTLKQEINKINSNISQVNLSIRSSEITVEKLGLEIDSVQYDISDAEKDIVSKEKAITKFLQEFQQKDEETPLIVFLRNKNLAESVSEVQTLVDLNNGLSEEVNGLKNTKITLASQLKEIANKKQATETEKENLKNKQIILSDTKNEKQTVLTQTKNQESLYQKSISDLEKRQTEIASEIENLDEELRLKINPSALPTKRPGVLAMPVPGAITQDYGATEFAKYGYRGKWHNGVDFAASIGTPVLSAEKGTAIAVGNSDRYCNRGAYGKFVVVEHENNLTTLYAHLSLQIIKKGDTIERGGLIGYSGKTGYATGPHLHFSVYASQTFRIGPSMMCGPLPYGGDLNPMDYL